MSKLRGFRGKKRRNTDVFRAFLTKQITQIGQKDVVLGLFRYALRALPLKTLFIKDAALEPAKGSAFGLRKLLKKACSKPCRCVIIVILDKD
ncbi:MAG: hypothetical protein K2M82_03725, partial [Lachnospiraceae bacterium]|nr:hypothetical protein [Lachnospiraceae bacterium]